MAIRQLTIVLFLTTSLLGMEKEKNDEATCDINLFKDISFEELNTNAATLFKQAIACKNTHTILNVFHAKFRGKHTNYAQKVNAIMREEEGIQSNYYFETLREKGKFKDS